MTKSFNDASLLDGTCQTSHVRLTGAHGYSKTMFINLVSHFGLAADVAEHLAHNYGDRAWEVAALSAPRDETSDYPFRGQKLSAAYPFIDGEIRYAVQNEYAQTAVDVLARRTRLSFLDANAALRALPRVIDTMSEELQWTEARKEAEWKETVYFLTTMGLPQNKAGITRDELLNTKQGSIISAIENKAAQAPVRPIANLPGAAEPFSPGLPVPVAMKELVEPSAMRT